MVDTAPLCAAVVNGAPATLNSLFLSSVAPNGASATVNAATPIGCAGGGISAGDLIMFVNASGEALMEVTGIAGQTMQFDPGDPMRLNQQGAAAGTILQLRDPNGQFPANSVRAYRVFMISYYIDTSVPTKPRLMRRVNLRTDRALGIGIENLQITYDLVDGATNPVNVAAPAGANSPHQIRKANVFVSGRSRNVWRQTRQYLRTSLSTQVSLRSLSFVDRYNPS